MVGGVGGVSITSLARMNIFPSAPPGRAEGAMQRRTFRQGGPERNTETCVCKPLGEGEGSGQMSRQGGFTYRTPDLGAPETRGRSETCVSPTPSPRIPSRLREPRQRATVAPTPGRLTLVKRDLVLPSVPPLAQTSRNSSAQLSTGPEVRFKRMSWRCRCVCVCVETGRCPSASWVLNVFVGRICSSGSEEFLIS